MGLRQRVGRLVRGVARTPAADEIDRLRAELEGLRGQVDRLQRETEGLRADVHGAVTDLTRRISAVSDRLERS